MAWTCPNCQRAFRLTVVSGRPAELAPTLRPAGLDSRCPKCGRFDLVVAPDASDMVIAVTYDNVD